MNAPITKDIDLAVSLLRKGELVSFPTETVYGLGADAQNPSAIQQVFRVKGRPADHPLIVHIASSDQLAVWAKDIPANAWLLAEHFWPGPLTMILRKQPSVSMLITGNQDTIAIRIPKHSLTLELLKRFGSGLVGPSANKYGQVSPTTAAHVAADLGTSVAAILDGGVCDVGIESTIINLCNDDPIIMRQGAITAAEISAVLGLDNDIKINTQTTNVIRVSGSHESHYAPNTKAYFLSKDQLDIKIAAYLQHQQKFSVLSFSARPNELPNNIFWQQASSDPKIYAHDLYANLRAHDQLGNSAILIEQVPNTLEWQAIVDRLTRACVK